MSDTPSSENPQKRGTRKAVRGLVVGDKMDKTIAVRVEHTSRHPLYRKTIKIRKKFYAHDPDNQAKVGDTVELMGTRPMSKMKRWRLVKVLSSGA